MIRKLDKTEYALAASLALEVYIQCGAEDFDEEGLNSFKSFISSEQLMNELVIYGAFEDKNLVGIMGTKHEGKHLYSLSEKSTNAKVSANSYSVSLSMIVR